jgi:imidazole glycerol-phosphate synthase subunit HisF
MDRLVVNKKIRLIPRLDVKGSNLVKGVHLEGLRVLGRPEEFAAEYYKDKADEIIFMDSVASLYGRNNLHEIVKNVADKLFIPMTVGGGIRSIDDVDQLLRSGADKVAINTALFQDIEIVSRVSDYFGSQCMVVSIDVVRKSDGEYECVTDNGRERTGVEVFSWIERVVKLGAGELMVTSVDFEGAGKGYDVNLIKRISERFEIPVIACGGAGNKEHVLDVLRNGSADAAAMSSILHYDIANKLAKDGEFLPEGNNDFLKKSKTMGVKSIRNGIESISIFELKEYLHSKGVFLRMQKNTEF